MGIGLHCGLKDELGIFEALKNGKNKKMFSMLHTLISKTPKSTITMQKGTLTNVLTCFHILQKRYIYFKQKQIF